MKRTKLTLLLFLFASIVFGQATVPFACYKDHVYAVSDINPDNTDFSDLQFLKEILQDDQIVILGEVGHGDGSAFQAKTRMIKFLVGELDFNAIALEAGGFWEIYYANEKIKAGANIHNELDMAWLGLWTLSEQTQSLIDYLSTTGKHIHLWGIDNQGENNYFRQFPQILMELIGEQAFESIDYNGFENNYAQIQNYLAVSFGDTTVQDQFDRPVLLEDLKIIKENLSKSRSAQTEVMLRGVDNIENYLDQLELFFGTYEQQNKAIDMRDKMMAENLNWWLQRNPKSKVIIWTANLHAAHHLDQVIYKENDDFYQTYKPLGARLKMEYGDKLFSIAINSAEGETAYFYEESPSTIRAAPDTWEYDLAKKIETAYAFINFENVRRDNTCSETAFKSEMLGYRGRTGNWFNVFDGVLFIRKMERSDYRE